MAGRDGHPDSDGDDVEYVVEFHLPEGTELGPEEWERMKLWLQRCHLDVLRQATPVSPKGAVGSCPGTAAGREGDCYVLEDKRGDSPVPVACFLGDVGEAGKEYDARFRGYLPTQTRIDQVIHDPDTPAPALRSDKQPMPVDHRSFILRPARDRGIFASKDRPGEVEAGGKLVVALYNASRIRRFDHLILSWRGPDKVRERGPGKVESEPSKVRGGRIFKVEDIAEGPPAWADGRYPKGSREVTLEPIDGPSPGRSSPGPEADGPLVGDWQVLGPLNNTEVLMAWKRLVKGLWDGGKPKLVVVTVSGGGIRASVWTALVLRKLEQALGEDFPYHVRLITGASGGMVGGTYYATSLTPPTDELLEPGGGLEDGDDAFAARHGVHPRDFVEQMARDQLDAVAGRLVFADLISPLNPFQLQGDRGQTLEQTWVRWTGGEGVSPLDRSLQSFAVDERLGWRPSMVYTPMMVEDGRRLLVSNLDLAPATRNLGGLLIEPSSRKIERPAFRDEDLDRSFHLEDEVFSLSAVEFSRLFPKAHGFPVTTAMRMSASFPWVSPAVSLPTLPPRRVVDAGYYDNYGVNLTAIWLAKMRPWLEANTSGVLVVQIRDHVSQVARTEIESGRPTGDSALGRLVWHADRELFTPGLQGITTPLLGVSNARLWTMSFRNDEQVDLLDLLFDQESSDEGDFFRTVVFECPVEVSLNWQLSPWEKFILTRGFGKIASDPHDELEGVVDYLTGPDAYELKMGSADQMCILPNQIKYINKESYSDQIRKLCFQGREFDRLTPARREALYVNIVKNLKRLMLLRDWWRKGRKQTAAERAYRR